MQINLKQLETGGFSEEKSLDFAFALDLSGVRQWGQAPFPKPAGVTGTAASRLGFLTIRYSVDLVRLDQCARCLAEVETAQTLNFSHTLMERTEPVEGPEENGDDIPYPHDGVLELAEVVIADLLLEQEPVILCSQDCLGLCPQCGANRNETQCSCEYEPDPGGETKQDSRFAALLDLMDQTEE